MLALPAYLRTHHSVFLPLFAKAGYVSSICLQVYHAGVVHHFFFTVCHVRAGNEALMKYGRAFWQHHRSEQLRCASLLVSCLTADVR